MSVTQAEVLNLFTQVGAIKNSDQFLVAKANANGTVTAAKITAELLRAYISAGFDITVGNDGLIYIGGNATTIDAASTIIVDQTDTTISIHPNKLNRWGAVQVLNVGFTAGASGRTNEYMMEFVVSGSNFTLTLPSGVRWVDGEQPDWEDGWTYQVSVLNGLAVAAGWEAPST